MTLSPGARLGVYEVRELIGAGGMGEVYRGQDTKLNRTVALKILPATFALDPDRLARFKREAQVLASLSHANIGAIFGFDDSGETSALVLEFVDGPTLADRIAQGPLPLEEALAIARQIADALDAAHAMGIVHRDLKPANIKIRPDGAVKVLDFGLAKALAGDSHATNATQSPTMTSPALTQMGLILGTAAYMSPEQARGRPADKRSDIWAFGVVLYEMLAGRRLFDGEDVSSTLAEILKSDPDWSALPADTPWSIRRVLRRCLEKDPRRRMHDVADARFDLDDQELSLVATRAARPRLVTAERVAWMLVVVGLANGLGYIALRSRPAAPVVRFQVAPPEEGFFGGTSGAGGLEGTSGTALSPDGMQLAFVANTKAGGAQLWVRRFDAFTSRPLPGTADGLMPFWSPDSGSLGFFAGGKLKRIDTRDGSIETIADAAGLPRGGSWGSRDVIVFSAGTPPRLARVPARGGDVVPIDVPLASYPRFPWFLPDGRHFLLVARLPPAAAAGLLIGSIEPGFALRRLVDTDSNGAFAPPGTLLYLRGGRLLQQNLDLDRLQVTGEATPIVDQVFENPGIGRADFSVSTTGVLAFRSTIRRNNQFAWFDRAGNRQETIGAPGGYRTPDLSPDGKRLVYNDVNQRDIYIFDLVRNTTQRLTSGPDSENSPVWFPDGNKVAYRKDQGGMFEIDTTGSGVERMLLADNVNGPDQVSADGKWIVYFAVTSAGNQQDVYVLPTGAGGKPQAVVQTPFADVEPQLSPNGRWLAYASNDNGQHEVYVQPFPSSGRRWRVSNTGGRQPLWRADGKELFYVTEEAKLYAVPVGPSADVFEFGTPKFLFVLPANVFQVRNSYIPNRQASRFLVNMIIKGDDAPINVVHNWRAAVK